MSLAYNRPNSTPNSTLTYAPDGTFIEVIDRIVPGIEQSGKRLKVRVGCILHQESLAQRHYNSLSKARATLEKRRAAKKNDGDNRQ
tara:strand:- start:408 stop:665 length:258 start_codon:yes stop_codon:yes gene_type:complete